jgi:hypothetical protein
MMNRQKYLWVAFFTLLSLPGLLLAISWINLQITRSQIVEPRWVNPGERFDEARSTELIIKPRGVISHTRALQIAWHVVDEVAGGVYIDDVWVYREGPTLVEATFPDGKQRLAYRWEAMVSLFDWAQGESARVYLDAKTGEPLVLITGIFVADPFMNERLDYDFLLLLPVNSDFYRFSGSLYLLISGSLVVIVLSARWLWGRIRKRLPLPTQMESFSGLQTWWLALTSPRTSTYKRLVGDPKATLSRGVIWILVSSTIAQIIMLIAALPQSRTPEWIFKLMLYGVPCITILVATGIFLYAGVAQFIAGTFGGRGTLPQLVYAISAYFAPITIIGALVVLIPIVRYLAIPLFLYSLVLQLIAIKTVYQFDWGHAIITGLILALFVAILYFGVLEPLIGTLEEVLEGMAEDMIRDTW